MKKSKSVSEFFNKLKIDENKKFFEELERDEQLKRDIESDEISEEEKYEIVKMYFNKLTKREFKTLLEEYKKKISKKIEIQDDISVAGGTFNEFSKKPTYDIWQGKYSSDGNTFFINNTENF